jgi:thiol-disulfide isomerase/thioredoxin
MISVMVTCHYVDYMQEHLFMTQRLSHLLSQLGAALLIGVGTGLILAAGLPERQDYTGVLSAEGVAPQVGAFAPDFTRPRLDGVPLTLSQQRGKIVLLNFWGTWCAPCEIEMPLLQILHEDYPDLILWAMDLGEEPAQITPWVEVRGLTFPILLDRTRALEYIYALRGQPSTFIIGGDGRIVTIIDGPIREEALRPLLDELFAKENES